MFKQILIADPRIFDNVTFSLSLFFIKIYLFALFLVNWRLFALLRTFFQLLIKLCSALISKLIFRTALDIKLFSLQHDYIKFPFQ